MKKIIRFTAYSIVLLFLVSLYSAAVVKVNNGENLGLAHRPIKFLSDFPGLVKRAFTETVKERNRLKEFPDDFKPINNLKKDIWVIRSLSNEGSSREVRIQNLKNDSVAQNWIIEGPFPQHFRIFNPLVCNDSNLIYNFNANSTLIKIDKDGKKLWEADSSLAVHHSLNYDHEGNVWACTTPREGPFIRTLSFLDMDSEKPLKYRDDELVNFSSETGEILYRKSLTELMNDHNLGHSLFQKSISLNDPFHLNDIDPILQDSGFFKRGDVLISIKNSHSIIHYRPNKDSIIKFIQGPFSYQHDVDFIDGHRISIFNNNMYPSYLKRSALPKSFNQKDSLVFKLKGSGVLIYDYNTNKFTELWPQQFAENKISTKTEGLSHFINEDLLLLEEQNSGILWIFSKDEVLYKNIFPSYIDGFREHLNWTRVIEN
tara:strand:- start:1155 stop:2441 length:1287 start_codon:yes stop_codon:yes gene_type:complete